MKKYTLILTSIFVLAIIFAVKTTYATVGGPTTVFDLKYDEKTSSIYYTEQSYSGRGCPPILKTVSYITGDTKTIYSCDDEGVNQEQKISAYTATFPSLKHINLRKNNITFSIGSGVVKNVENTTEKERVNFVAHTSQNNNKLLTLPLSGCSFDQPYVVDGYVIPGINDKLVLLISGKSDCWEGGYIFERVVLVSGVQFSDSSEISAYKDRSALVPNEGSIVVYPETTQKKFVWWNPFTWFGR